MGLRLFGILLLALTLNAQELKLQVLATTDLHGHILPQDTFTQQPVNQGWAKLATLIHDLERGNPNTLLVDCGDATSGEPIDYVWSHLKPGLPEPNTAIMNLLGYHAMVVGNHEFDGGLDQARGMEAQAKFPWLAANAVLAATGKPAFTPFVIRELGGVRVAILGLTTAGMPRLVDGANITGLAFRDAVATARIMVPRLRSLEKADVVIVALHGGLGMVSAGPADENQALALATVPGIDLILTGHTHQQISQVQGGTPILQAGRYGQALGVAELEVARSKGKWQVVSRKGRLIQPTADTVPDPGVLEATAPLQALTDTYLNTFATNLGTDLDGRFCRMEGTALMRLLHTVGRRACGAQIIAMSPPGPHLFIARGPTSVRQFYALVPWENRMARIEVTGAQLRAYLEHAARAFNLSHQAELFNRAVASWNFDTLDGCDYVLDLSRLPGARVTELKVDGHPVQDDQRFSLGITSFRLAGGGGYLEAMGWTGQPAFVSPDSLRNQLLEYVLSRPTLDLGVPANWHTVPALDRERVLAQQPE